MGVWTWIYLSHCKNYISINNERRNRNYDKTAKECIQNSDTYYDITPYVRYE